MTTLSSPRVGLGPPALRRCSDRQILPNGAGHTYSFRPPDPVAGQLLPAVSDWRDDSKRTRRASILPTVVKALGIPESEYAGRFSKSVVAGVPLACMLRG